MAAPTDASDPPRTSGPLVGTPLPCEDNGNARDGEVRGQACSWSYELAAHTKATSDYWAYWTQIEIDPGRGTCAKKISFTFEVSGGTQIVSVAPAPGAASPRRSRTELIVDADGGAPIPGRIEQDVEVPSGRVSVDLVDGRYRYVWRGNARRKVMVAIGLQLANDRVPPELETVISTRTGSGAGSCRFEF